jgi:hypothetical protein
MSSETTAGDLDLWTEELRKLDEEKLQKDSETKLNLERQTFKTREDALNELKRLARAQYSGLPKSITCTSLFIAIVFSADKSSISCPLKRVFLSEFLQMIARMIEDTEWQALKEFMASQKICFNLQEICQILELWPEAADIEFSPPALFRLHPFLAAVRVHCESNQGLLQLLFKEFPRYKKIGEIHDMTQKTPLLYAFEKCLPEADVFRFLLDHCREFAGVPDELNMTPLYRAIELVAPSWMIKEILEAAPEAAYIQPYVRLYSDNLRPPAVHEAIIKYSSSQDLLRVVELLPKTKKQEYLLDEDGNTALHVVAEWAGDCMLHEDNMLHELVSVLLHEHTTWLGKKNHEGHVPLYVALRSVGEFSAGVIRRIQEAFPQAVFVKDENGQDLLNLMIHELSLCDSWIDEDATREFTATARRALDHKVLPNGRAFRPLCKALNVISLQHLFNIFSSASPDDELPTIDLNDQSRIKDWSFLKMIVDFDDEEASSLFFTIFDQLQSDIPDYVTISTDDGSAKFRVAGALEQKTLDSIVARASGCSNQRLNNWARSLGVFLGRYNIDGIIYRSSTSTVAIAECVDENGEIKAKKVALKFMKNEDAFLRELESRSKLCARQGKQAYTDHAVPILSAYAVRGIVSDVFQERRSTRQPAVDLVDDWNNDRSLCRLQTTSDKGDRLFFGFLIVMPSSADLCSDLLAIVTQGLIRENFHLVSHAAINIAKSLQFINEQCRIVHGDVKARNFVKVGGDFRAIDFDNACEVGESAGKKVTSTGYLPPEQARKVLFGAGTQGLAQLTSVKGVNAYNKYDMWCFGVLLYQLCANEDLFPVDKDRENAVDVATLKDIAEFDESNLKTKLSRVKPGGDWSVLKTALRSLLQPKPDDRPECWDDVLRLLEGTITIPQFEVLMERLQDVESKLIQKVNEQTELILDIHRVKCPYIFQVVSEKTFLEQKEYKQDTGDALALFESKLAKANELLDQSKRIYDLARDKEQLKSTLFSIALNGVTGHTENVSVLQLLCGKTLQPVVSYRVVETAYSDWVMGAARLGSRLCTIGIQTAMLWNAASGAARMFGYPVPELPKEEMKKAKNFMERFEQESPFCGVDMEKLHLIGFTLEELDDFAQHLAQFEEENAICQLNDARNPEELRGKSWTDALVGGSVDVRLKDGSTKRRYTFVSKADPSVSYGGNDFQVDTLSEPAMSAANPTPSVASLAAPELGANKTPSEVEC